MAYNNSDQAVILPSIFGSPSQALDEAISYKERQQQRSDALAERQREFDQRMRLSEQEKANANKLHNLTLLNKVTDYAQYETPEKEINNLAHSRLNDILNASLNDVKESPEVFEGMLKNRIKDFADWHSMVKTDLENSKAKITEFNKTLPNTDLGLLNDIVKKGILDNYTQVNPQTGKREPIPSHLVRQGVDYMSPLNDPSVLAQVTNNTQPLYDFFKNVPKEAIHGSEYVNKKGNVISNRWSGFGTPYTQVVGDENDKPTAIVPYESAMVTEQGEQIKVANKTLRDAMAANPAVEASFNKLWQDEIYNKGLQNVDKHALDILKENFRHSLAEKQLLPTHQVSLDEKQVTPKPPVVNVNLGKEVQYNDIFNKTKQFLNKEGFTPLTALPSDARNYYVESINKNRPTDSKLDENKLLMVEADNGDLRVIDGRKGKEDVVGVFDKTGTNLGVNKQQKPQQKILKEANIGIKTETKLTPTEWSNAWSKLKKGQTMVGLDGKTYTKQ